MESTTIKQTREYPLLDIPLHSFPVLCLTTTVCYLFRVGYDLPNDHISFTVLGSVIERDICITRSIYIYIFRVQSLVSVKGLSSSRPISTTKP